MLGDSSVCLSAGCHKAVKSRGLCVDHYSSAWYQVTGGKTTWHELAAKGDALLLPCEQGTFFERVAKATIGPDGFDILGEVLQDSRGQRSEVCVTSADVKLIRRIERARIILEDVKALHRYSCPSEDPHMAGSCSCGADDVNMKVQRALAALDLEK